MDDDDAGSGSSQTQEPPKDEKPQDSQKHSDPQCHSLGDGSTEHQSGDHPDHKKSRSRSRSQSRSRSPHGSCSPPPRVHSGDGACTDDRSKDKRWQSRLQITAHTTVMTATGTIPQGGHGTWKTGNLAVNFSRQGKHREFSKFNFLHRENCGNTGKILNFLKILLLKWQQGDGAFLS